MQTGIMGFRQKTSRREQSNEKVVHEIVIGYNFTATNQYVAIMDPAYEMYSLCSYNQGNGWTFPFGNDVYKWTRTVRITD